PVRVEQGPNRVGLGGDQVEQRAVLRLGRVPEAPAVRQPVGRDAPAPDQGRAAQVLPKEFVPVRGRGRLLLGQRRRRQAGAGRQQQCPREQRDQKAAHLRLS